MASITAPVVCPVSRAVPSMPLAAPRAVRRRAGDDGVVVGRLEQPEADAAQRHAPDDVGAGRLRRQRGQQRQAGGQQRQADAAEQAVGHAADQPAGDRRHGDDAPAARR